MMLTRRRDPSAPSPCTDSGEGEPTSSGPVGLAALPRPVAVVVGAGGVLALNGAIAAAHPDRAAPWLEHVWTQLRRLIARAGLPRRIEELAVPFTAVATGLVTGAPALLDRGDLASAAVPGLLPPVDREGRTLVDGGVIAYVPVPAALRAGAAGVVVVPTGPESSPPPATLPPRRAAAIASRAGLLLMHRQIERDLAEVSRRLPTVVLPTGTDVWPATWDFRHSRRLIEAATATAATTRWAPRLTAARAGL
ncbi:patatin-like phospholipase family protein [Streptomyces sp. NPDC018026]|uniref:patatin-like phospholipase family protein n=1 Tax=Streptomyces sp. NPDC018026 TaxID=3365031 RepID=UPI003794820C